jgi:hypothetical protein
MEKTTFTRVNLSDVRIIMVIMYVLMEEFVVSGLSGALGHLWLRPVMFGIK